MRIFAALALSIVALRQDPAAPPKIDDPRKPAAVETSNVPLVPGDVFDRLKPYHAVRGAGFVDWAPNGKDILFSRRAGSTSQLHLMTADGRIDQLTSFPEPVAGGGVLGGNLYFTMGTGGDEQWQVYRMDLGARTHKLLTDGKSRHALNAPNRAETKAVVGVNRKGERDTDLFIMDLETGALEPLLATKGQTWSAQDWSPDDSKILLLHYVSANESYPHVMDVATRKVTPIPVPGGALAAHDAMKFASNEAVYVSSDAGREFKTLARVDLATLKYEWLTTDIPWDVVDIEVEDGRIVFVTNEDGASRVYALEGGKPVALSIPLGIVGGVEMSGTKIGFTLNKPDAPGDVYSLEDGRVRHWKCNDLGGLEGRTFSVPERLSVASFDGTKVPFYVYRPARGAKPAPVIISIHGGPEGQYRPGFSGLAQYYVTEMGCAMIGPNVRGSTGYGKTYVAADNAEKREDSVRDIGAILDWIATQPDLDAKRVCVMGGSYGGYMVLASLVHFGPRLRAGVDVVGIANFTTFLRTTSAYRQDLRRAEYGDERDPKMQEVFERISPSNHADKITSALLVAHGKNDPRVPFGEAQLIAAKAKGAVWTVYAANEGHGFAKRENREYLDGVLVAFFREFLLK